jgi:O-antigen/teichoic acid export membrane protein
MRELFYAVVKTGGGSFLNLLLGILTNKIFAVYLGPEGVGLFSLLRQIRDTTLTITTFHGGTALVQGLASRKDEERKNYSLVVFMIMILSTLIAVIALLLFAPQISRSVLNQDSDLSVSLVRSLSIPLVFGTAMMFLVGILNGYRAIGRLAMGQVTITVVTLLLAYPTTLLVQQGNKFALVAMMAISSAAGVIFTYGFVRKQRWFPPLSLIFSISKDRIVQAGYYFLSFAITTLITGLANTWTSLMIRSMIVSVMGLSVAGIFDVSWTLSMMYITLALSSFGTYYLPTLSQTKDSQAQADLIMRVQRLTQFIIVPLVTAMIVLKPLVIQLLYSSEFLPALTTIRWMLIGDYFKASSWVFGVTITASADKKTLLISEILWQIGFLGLSALSLYKFHTLEGIGIAFVLLYCCHLIFTYIYGTRKYHLMVTFKKFLRWGIGLLILIGASVSTWTSLEVNWAVATLWLVFAIVSSIFSLDEGERARLIVIISKKVRLLGRGQNAG